MINSIVYGFFSAEFLTNRTINVESKGKAIPLQVWTGPEEFEATRFQDKRHMKVVTLSALRTGHLYPQKTFLVLISVRG